MSLLGLDLGTTNCRAALVSVDGDRLALARQDYKRGASAGQPHEIDVREVWEAVCQAIRQVAASASGDPVQALSLSSVGEAITPLSTEAKILGPCILGTDPRGAEYVEQVTRALGEERFFEITGRIPGGSHTLSKLCWLRDHDSRLYQWTWRFTLLNGLVCHLMGGSSLCDYSMASGTLLFDIEHRRWSRDILRACDLLWTKLPDLADVGQPVGSIPSPVARDLGLPAGVGLFLGGHDLCCNALGAGVIHSGMASYNLGGSMHLALAFNAIPLTSLMRQRGLSMEHHVIPDLFLSTLYNRSGGRVLRWFRDTLTPMEKREAQRRGADPYATLLAEMPEEPTSLMVLPDFEASGPPQSAAHWGGAILGLTLETTRGEIIKALLEGMTYYFAVGQALLEQVGIPVQVYRATGGGTRSERWLQLVADILGLPVERTDLVYPASLGAAMLAGLGSKAYADPQQAVEAQVRVEKRFEPDPKRHRTYRHRVDRYRELHSLIGERGPSPGAGA